jgi:hypothetical protein
MDLGLVDMAVTLSGGPEGAVKKTRMKTEANLSVQYSSIAAQAAATVRNCLA